MCAYICTCTTVHTYLYLYVCVCLYINMFVFLIPVWHLVHFRVLHPLFETAFLEWETIYLLIHSVYCIIEDWTRAREPVGDTSQSVFQGVAYFEMGTAVGESQLCRRGYDMGQIQTVNRWGFFRKPSGALGRLFRFLSQGYVSFLF